jgi:Uncharacterised nucleotidyltransferase
LYEKYEVEKACPVMLAEDNLIISGARTVVTPSLAEEIRGMLNADLDWEYIQQASLRHAVLPLVYQTLHKVSPESLPDSLAKKMKNHLRGTVVRNMKMGASLLKILTLFEEHGITAVPFKGPVLAEDIYGDLGFRNFSDLDILLWPHDAAKAIALLSNSDFEPLINLSPSQLTAYMKGEDDMVMMHRTDSLVVELHWEMTGRYISSPFDMAFINKRLERVTLLNTDVPNLSPEDLLLYLCIHGTRHMWERLEWICCIAELVRNKSDLQWDKAFKLASDVKCSRIVRHGLYLAHELLEVELPAQVTKELAADPTLPQLAEQIKQQFFPLLRPGQTVAGGNRFKRLQFQVRDSLWEQVVYGWRQLTMAREADWRWLPLPAYLAFLYMFLRPLRLGLKKMGIRYKV